MAITIEYEPLSTAELRNAAGYEMADARPEVAPVGYGRAVGGAGYETGDGYGSPGRSGLISRMLRYFAAHPEKGLLTRPHSTNPQRRRLEDQEYEIYFSGMKLSLAALCREYGAETKPTAPRGGWLSNARARLRLLEAMIAMEVHR